VLVIDPASGSDLWEMGEPLENPIVTKQDAESPLMRHVRLDNVILPQARQLKPIGEAQVLAEAVSGDPLYFAVERAGGKVAVLTVNLDEGDLTFRTAFPILVTNALGWFAGEAGELQEALVSGAVTETTLPTASDDTAYTLIAPSGAKQPLPEGATKVSLGPLDEVGVWRVEQSVANAAASDATKPTVVHEFACNLASAVESDLRPPNTWQERSVTALAASGWFVRPLWFYLVAVAWGLATVEWFLYQRRWIG
jgi:hypothetical protein